jgi:hypothetical protein
MSRSILDNQVLSLPTSPLRNLGHSRTFDRYGRPSYHLVKMSNGELWRSHVTPQLDRPCLRWGFMADLGLYLSPII